jgi:magnesium transporter
MLSFYGSKIKGAIALSPEIETLPKEVSWIDAFDPTPEERARLEHLMGIPIPTHNDLLEIESSSRLAVAEEALIMSLPAMVKDETGYPKSTPIGFIVTADCVATIRFDRLPSFENLSRSVCDKGALADGGYGAAISLFEMIVDQLADLLERVGEDLDAISRRIFATGLVTAKSRRPHQSNRLLTSLLQAVGRNADLASKASETLLGLSRIPPFLAAAATSQVTPERKSRLDTISADTKSLHEYQDHLTNKAQFLLDAVLGLANIEQNNVFRVLTVVSVIGIPPTFFASMYGMNFKTMPEYDWAHGYAYGLTLIALSAIAPALWFKVKGWW